MRTSVNRTSECVDVRVDVCVHLRVSPSVPVVLRVLSHRCVCVCVCACARVCVRRVNCGERGKVMNRHGRASVDSRSSDVSSASCSCDSEILPFATIACRWVTASYAMWVSM
jgi:hypothetical protein